MTTTKDGGSNNLRNLLGEDYYNELQLTALYKKAQEGAFMPSLYDWLKKVNPDFNWDWPHTKYIIDHLQKVSDGEIRKLMIFTPPRHGKLCSDSTPVLTTKGWRKHGDLVPGDYVYHPSGKPVKVLAISEKTMSEYNVTLSTGETILTHGNHEWYVHCRYKKDYSIFETKEMYNHGVHNGKLGKRGSRFYYHLDPIDPIEHEYKALEIDPYVFGAWLGDGTSTKPAITYHKKDKDTILEIERRGYRSHKTFIHSITGAYTTYFSYSGLTQSLRRLNVYNNKHIPEIYKFSSIEQRQELIAGLIDTDGHVDKNGRVRIVTVSERLADDIVDVLYSLGQYPYKTYQEPTLSTSGIQGTEKVYTVGFQPSIIFPTVLKRKKIKTKPKLRRIAITDIEKIENGEQGHCIQVDSSDGLYLVGKTLIPTHNSELASIHFPTFFLEKNPQNRVIIGTYNQTLANKLSRRVRSLCKTRIELDPDRKAMEEWDTKEGGGCRAVGVGAGVAGIGANLIIIDDPIRSRKDAASKTVRDSTYSWYTDDIFTRMEPDSRIVLIMTLWHEDDLAGRIQQFEDDWTIIKLPALAEENDPLGRRIGEALCPARFSRDQLLEIKAVMGRSFFALYQQRPQEQEGEFFKASWFHKIDRLPEPEEEDRFEYVRFWDKAATTDGDYTVGVLIAKNRRTGYYYVLDMVRGQWLPHTRDTMMLRTAQKDQELYGHVKTFHEEEPGSSGKDAARQTNMLLSGYPVKAIRATGNKQLRAEPYQSQVEAGNVFILVKDWTPDFIDEHATFPNGAHDDIVDAASGAFNQLTKGKGFISIGSRLR